MTQAFVVAGLGFGDEGKGSTVDALVRKHKARLVVRYNGGAQAAHNVVCPDGTHHTFAQFGSGTLAGADTLLSRFVLVNPISFMKEAEALIKKCKSQHVSSRVHVEREAPITTPFHVAANRIREMTRTGRHGSCGMGIGETMADIVDGKETVTVKDLADKTTLKAKLNLILDRKRTELKDLIVGRVSETDPIYREWSLFDQNSRFIDRIVGYYGAFEKLVHIVDETYLAGQLSNGTIFEGAQGVLLDQDFGFQPYTTWTDCTFGNARTLLDGHSAQFLGILRAYQTRHGNGPLPTEDARYTECSAHDHNTLGEWQGAFRSGPLDMVLSRYAIDVIGGVDGLVMTNLDRLEYAKGGVKICTGYREYDETFTTRIPVKRPVDLEHQAELAKGMMGDIQSTYENVSDWGYAEMVASMLGTKLVMTSDGPSADDKTWM